MLTRLLYIASGFMGSIILLALVNRISFLAKGYDLLYTMVMGIVTRIDKLLTGNDGNYSHARFLNILWGVGSFILICVAVLRALQIPNSILVLMGAGMGINMSGTVVNKIQEVKQQLSSDSQEKEKNNE